MRSAEPGRLDVVAPNVALPHQPATTWARQRLLLVFRNSMSSPEPVELARPTTTLPRRRTRTVALTVTVGTLVGLAISLLSVGWFFRSSAAPLTDEALAAAEKNWESAGPASYNLDLELVGSQAGTIQVEVRNGEVTRMVRNGHVPRQRRTWYYWSVPGQFETIHIDLAGAEHPDQAFGVAPGTRAVIRAEFDERLGYPKFYQRILLGTGIHVEWTTTRFEVVP